MEASARNRTVKQEDVAVLLSARAVNALSFAGVYFYYYYFPFARGARASRRLRE